MEKHISPFNARQTMNCRDFEIFHRCDMQLEHISLHHHDFYEIYFYLRGEVSYQIENRNYPLMPGDLLLVSPNELHQVLINPPSGPYERILLWLDRHYLKELSHHTGLNLGTCFDTTLRGRTSLIRLTLQERELLLDLANILLGEQNSQQYGQEAMRRSGMSQLMIMINRLTNAFCCDPVPDEEHDPLIDKVFDFINDHIGEDLSLERLEDIFFFDSGTLTRRFKKQIGDTISQYIRKKRLNIAKNLLSEGSPPIEVYAQCGFVDYSGFFRAFKLQYGMSPKEFVKTKI